MKTAIIIMLFVGSVASALAAISMWFGYEPEPLVQSLALWMSSLLMFKTIGELTEND